MQSKQFAAALEKAGVPVELIVVPGAGHGKKGFQSDKARGEIRNFLEKRFAE